MLYRRGGIWWVKFKRGGETHRLSTGEGNRRKALHEAARLTAQTQASPGPERRYATPTLIALAVKDIANAEDRGKSDGHVGSLDSMWRAIREYFGAQTPITAITHESMTRYEGHRRKQGIRGQTIRKEIGCLKRAFEIATRDMKLDAKPPHWPKIATDAPHPSRRGRLVPRAVLDAYLAELPVTLRNEMIVAFETGLREAELHRLERSWVEKLKVGGWIVRVPAHASKTRRERIVPLPPRARKLIDAAGPDVFRKDRWRGRYWHRKAAKTIGLPGPVTLRDLRTTYGSNMVAATGDAQAVQDAMGHNDLRTTQKYQRTTLERMERLGKAAGKMMGKTKGAQKRGHKAPSKRANYGRRGGI